MSDLPPKKYMIRCLKCRWGRTTAGVADDLKGLTEMPRTCMNCGSPRTFKCPTCGRPAKMLPIKR